MANNPDGNWDNRQGLGGDRQGDRQGTRDDRQGDRQGTRDDRQGDREGNREERQGERDERSGDRQDNRQDMLEDRQDFRQEVYNDHEEWHSDNHEYYDDAWRYAVGATLTAATFSALTCASRTVVIDGATFYNCGPTWYNRAYSGGSVTYVVVTAPPGY
jgi:hypothetical protein